MELEDIVPGPENSPDRNLDFGEDPGEFFDAAFPGAIERVDNIGETAVIRGTAVAVPRL